MNENDNYSAYDIQGTFVYNVVPLLNQLIAVYNELYSKTQTPVILVISDKNPVKKGQNLSETL